MTNAQAPMTNGIMHFTKGALGEVYRIVRVRPNTETRTLLKNDPVGNLYAVAADVNLARTLDHPTSDA
jgi:hypothetical protein